MGILTDDMRRVVAEQRLGDVATVCADGTPNLSPKGTTAVWDGDHLVFADIASPRSVANLRRKPAVEINVVDPIARKGYRFKGTATDLAEGERLAAILAWYRRRGIATPIRAVVLVRVERAQPLITPAYDGGATETEARQRWREHDLDTIGWDRGAGAGIGRRSGMPNRLTQQVRRVAVTDPIAAAGTYDYADAFEVRLPEPDRYPPEIWVRAGLAATPKMADRIVGLLGPREEPAPGRLGVFRIVESGPAVVHLEASTPLMRVVAVGRQVEPDRRVMTTVLRYQRPVFARLLWAIIGPIHRRLARQLVATQVPTS